MLSIPYPRDIIRLKSLPSELKYLVILSISCVIGAPFLLAWRPISANSSSRTLEKLPPRPINPKVGLVHLVLRACRTTGGENDAAFSLCPLLSGGVSNHGGINSSAQKKEILRQTPQISEGALNRATGTTI